VLFVGRLSAEKNVSLFLSACERLVSEGRAFQAVVVGEGPEGAKLSEMLHTRPWLHWIPRAHRGQVLDLMFTSSALAICSIYEGLPTVLVEALGAGLPVVSTDVGRSREFLREPTGLVVEADPRSFSDALQRILALDPAMLHRADPELRKRIDFKTTASTIAAVLRDVSACPRASRRRYGSLE
jgi:glycosyltransferase involved in cell wall biosynthesis